MPIFVYLVLLIFEFLQYHFISDIDESLLPQLIQFLKIFKEYSDMLEADSVPTLQHVAVAYFAILEACALNDGDHEILQEYKVILYYNIKQGDLILTFLRSL